MRNIRTRKKFRHDLKRELSGKYSYLFEEGGEFVEIVDMLAADKVIALSYQDHKLKGDKQGLRECHLRPDLLFVYRYVGDDWLILEELGSHSEILGL